MLTHRAVAGAALAAALALLSVAAAIAQPAAAPADSVPPRVIRRVPFAMPGSHRAPLSGADSTVRAVLNGGGTALVQIPAVESDIPTFWRTRAERTNYAQTADYDETMRFCRQLEAGSRWVKLTSYGRSGQGRELPLLIVSKDRAFTPEAARATGKPVILIQNGIHAGEIEGKDASLALLRDLTVLRKREALLDSVTLLILPIFSVDAHERSGRYNRINQNGPEEMGWRHTPAGFNLNRDYLKVDSPEMRSLIGNVYTKWWPDLLIDDHTTDGADYRHDVTYAFPHGPGAAPSLERWLTTAFEGRVLDTLRARGRLPAPYVSFRKGHEPRSGIDFGSSSPRFSSGYPALQSRAAILVETHMLKPYGVRVRATYDLLLAVIEEVSARPRALTGAVREAEAEAIARGRNPDARARSYPVATGTSEVSVPFEFKGVETRWEFSEITGAPVPRWQPAPWDTIIPLFRDVVATTSVIQPLGGYLVPQEWTEAIERLRLHGVRTRMLTRAHRDTVERVRVARWTLAGESYEGRVRVSADSLVTDRVMASFRPGDLWVPLDQPGAAVAVHLLEAASPDGLFQWGFLHTILQRKEYGEDYVVDPLAHVMMARDPRLAAEFRARLARDPAFARDPGARTDFFYSRSPWMDPEQGVMPFARLLRPVPGASLQEAPAPPSAPGTPRR